MTPGGTRNGCPVCRAALSAPADTPFGPARCPRCGGELWFVVFSVGPVFFIRRPGESVYHLLAGLAWPEGGRTAEQAEEVFRAADSLDVVEMLMEVEARILGGDHERG
jgi:hypothetical protein